jgi:hypothetical protein
VNTISLEDGSTSCDACPDNSATSGAVRTKCTCDAGYFSADGFATTAACTSKALPVGVRFACACI